MPQTLFEKVWNQHIVVPETADTPAVLYIDLHLIHEVTTPQAFSLLRERGLAVRRPDRTLATMDHSTPTTPVNSFKDLAIVGDSAANQIRQMETNCREFGIDLLGFDSHQRGIVHVIGPELGATQPGKTIVCGDSHTSTHGAFGALAFGIGTTEVGHVLATQCLLAAQAENACNQRRRPTAGRCRRQGPDPRDHRPDRRRRRHGTRHRISRRSHSSNGHGGAHDGLQHVDRRPARAPA